MFSVFVIISKFVYVSCIIYVVCICLVFSVSQNAGYGGKAPSEQSMYR